MNRVKVIVIRAAGSNCDGETVHAFERCGAQTELVHINALLRQEKDLHEYQILAIPGGFTYGDDISAGKILANELKYLLTEELVKFIGEGKLIIGICNGFQVLVKAGLLPDSNLAQAEPETTLSFNDSGKFEDRWVYLKQNNRSKCVFSQNLPEVIYLPVAHSEGKFICRNNQVLKRLKTNEQIVFQYADAHGNPVDYPGNPNGSIAGIAGICDASGRVLGLMPHPERFVVPIQHPRWTREGKNLPADGLQIFKSGVDYALKNL
jgi:phosphoribosylformylglycinamidine synthase